MSCVSAGAVENILTSSGHRWRIRSMNERKTPALRFRKITSERTDAGDEFAQQQDLAAHRSKQVIVQAALDHLAADERHEYAERPEKDSEPQVIELEDAGQDFGVLCHRFVTRSAGEYGMDEDDERRREREEVNPRTSAR